MRPGLPSSPQVLAGPDDDDPACVLSSLWLATWTHHLTTKWQVCGNPELCTLDLKKNTA